MNSTNAAGKRPPSWIDFLKRAIASCPGTPASKRPMTAALNAGDLLTCCQLVKYRMGAAWSDFLEAEFRTPDFKPHTIHKNIFALDASIIITPNIDRIYDDHAVTQTTNHIITKTYVDDDIGRFLRGTEKQRLILKIHGSIDSPEKCVFSRGDYADVRTKHSVFYRALSALILTNTFIFLGCGLRDPDLVLMLEEYARAFADSPPHYFVTSQKVSDDEKRMLHDNYRLLPIQYSAADSHLELTNSLAQLGVLVDEKRDDLRDRVLW